MSEQIYFKIHQPFTCVYHIEDPMGVFVTLIVGSKRAALIDTGDGNRQFKADSSSHYR